MANINLRGYVLDQAGNGITGLTATLFDQNDEVTSRATDTTDGNGQWDFNYDTTDGPFDVRVVNGTQEIWYKSGTKLMLEELTMMDSKPIVFGTDGDANLEYDGTNLVLKPAIVGSGDVKISGGGLLLNTDNEKVTFGTGSDATIFWDGTNMVIEPSVGGSGFLVINDATILMVNETLNGKMTVGLTLNQAANDNEILALKSSDVNHAATDIAENDTYARLQKAQATSGGLLITGLKDGDGDAGLALELQGILDETAANGTKSTSGIGVVAVTAQLESSNGVGDVGTSDNLMIIRNNATTRFIFDGGGSSYADIAFITFDAEDDLMMIADLEREMVPDKFGESLVYNREAFERLGIVGKDSWHEEDGQTHAMVNFTRLAMLHHGALVQVGDRLNTIESRMMALEAGA